MTDEHSRSFLRYKLLFNFLIHCHRENLISDFPTHHCFFSKTMSRLTCTIVYLYSSFAYKMRWMEFASHRHDDSSSNHMQIIYSVQSYDKFCFILTLYFRYIDICDLQLFYNNFQKDIDWILYLLFCIFFRFLLFMI